jgi:Asp-tRNA(Asn)/Glu-tRNA(Gln) amidotransferase A subunit family amidase
MGLRDLSVEGCARAIHEHNDRLGAVIHVLAEPLRDASARHDAPLAGVPYVLKDTWDTAGILTTGGSWRHRARVPSMNVPVADAIAKTGAVLLGKSNLSDLALAWESDNHIAGPARNPLDPARSAGGSTGGGAAAVAAGMAAFDWGSDFGGSIRLPAGFCGVTGLRLSAEAWPVRDMHFPRLAPHFWSWNGMGPIAQTVDDCRDVVAALAPALRTANGEERMRTGEVVVYMPDRRCIGKWPTFVGDVARLLMATPIRFEVDRSLPPPWHINEIYNGYLSSHFEEFCESGEISAGEGTRAVLFALATQGRFDKRIHPTSARLLLLIALGRYTLYREARRWERELEALRAGVRAIWSTGRLIVAPTTTSPPARHGRSAFDWTVLAFTKLGNLVDATSIAIPFGRFDGTDLPRSIQILGPPGSERSVIELAEKIEREALGSGHS